MSTDIQVQYWCLIWDRDDRFHRQNIKNFPSNQPQDEPPKQFIIQDGADMGYKFLLKKAGELTKEKVNEITYKKSDGVVVVVCDDESLGYVKRLEQVKRAEGGSNAVRETVLMVKTTESIFNTLFTLVFGLSLVAVFYCGSLRFYFS